MKTLKLASFAALFLFVIASCTKDSTSLSSTDSSARTTLLSGKKGDDTGAPGETQGGTGLGNTKQTPTVLISFSPEIGVKGELMTVTGSFDLSAPVPDCGHLQLEWLVDGEWEAAGEKADVTTTNKTVSFQFTPVNVGDEAYSFRVHYVASGGDGSACNYHQVMSDPYTLKVIEPCVNVFTIEGDAVAKHVSGDLYDITVTYTLTSPEDVSGIHFQGGATSGGKFQHVIIDEGDFFVVNDNKQNTVLAWEGDLTGCTEKKLTFTFRRNYSCSTPDEFVTGEWKATVGEEVLGIKPRLTATCQ